MVLEHDNFSIVNTWSFYSGCLFGGDYTKDNRVTWRRVDNEKWNWPILHSHKPKQYNWVLVWLLKWFFYCEGKITLCWHVPTMPSKPLTIRVFVPLVLFNVTSMTCHTLTIVTFFGLPKWYSPKILPSFINNTLLFYMTNKSGNEYIYFKIIIYCLLFCHTADNKILVIR